MNSYDKNNVPLFEAGEHNKYLCSMCGQYTTISDSVSSKGWNLICNHCLYKMRHILDANLGELMIRIQNTGQNRQSVEGDKHDKDRRTQSKNSM